MQGSRKPGVPPCVRCGYHLLELGEDQPANGSIWPRTTSNRPVAVPATVSTRRPCPFTVANTSVDLSTAASSAWCNGQRTETECSPSASSRS